MAKAEKAARGARPETESESIRTEFETELLADAVIQVIKGMMEAHGISQRELAERLRVSQARVSRILNDSENMKLSMVAALGRVVGVRFALVPIPFEDRSDTPAATDPPPPRWLAGLRRLVANSTSASGPAPKPGR